MELGSYFKITKGIYTYHCGKTFMTLFVGNYLAIQCLGLLASTARGRGLIPGWELRSCMPQSIAKKKKKDIVKRKRKAGQKQYINMIAYMLKKHNKTLSFISPLKS